MRIAGFGLTEILIILLVVLLIFGATRLPGIGSALGKGIRSFKTSVTGEDEVASREGSSTEAGSEERQS